jgi:ABC-type glycerol-3-phosphate transport system permease component
MADRGGILEQGARRDRPEDRLWPRTLRLGKHAVVVGVLLFALFPFYMMFSISLKTNAQFYSNPLGIQPPFHFRENWFDGARMDPDNPQSPKRFDGAWEVVSGALANTLVVAIAATALGVVGALAGAYFFARYRMPGAHLLWALMVLLLMMPTIANLVPLFVLLKNLSLLNTLWALILVGAAGTQAFNIFVLRSFVEQIPNDLFEAAEIDGASHFQQFWNIVVPLSGPITGTIAVMSFLNSWNDFIMPLIVIRDTDLYTVTVCLLRLDGEYLKYWGPLMAGFAISSIPVVILFVFTMRLFIRGMTEGAVKG